MTRLIETTHSPLPKTVVRLSWVSFFTDVSSEMILPLLPAFLVTVLGAPALALGWIEGVAETTAAFVKIVSGRMTDRAARKKPLVLFGYGLSTAVRPLISLAGSWPAVLVLRFLDRIGKGMRSAPRDTLIAAATPPERRGAAFGLHRAFDNAGAVLGPLVASALLLFFHLPLRAVFAAAIVPGVVALLILAFFVREPQPAAPPSLARTDATPLPSAFWRSAWVIALFTLAASSDTFLLLKAQEIGIAAVWLPVLWAFSNAVRAALGRWGGGLSDRLGRKPVLLLGWTLYGLCYAAFGLVSSVVPFVVALGVYSVHAAFTEGVEKALVADLVPAGSRGRAFGTFHALTGLAALPASAGFGLLWSAYGSRTAFLAGGLVALLAALLLAILVPHRKSG